MEAKKKIALVAHDNKKQDLISWARFNKHLLTEHVLYATGTSGRLLEQELGLPVHKLQSGPLGGDQQVGAKIATGEIDFLIFFWDPLETHAHGEDVKALIRLAVVWNIPVACNRASADYMISSPLLSGSYQRRLPDYEAYLERTIEESATDGAPNDGASESPANAGPGDRRSRAPSATNTPTAAIAADESRADRRDVQYGRR
ncbi:MAG TPA: methylglyoxal synthase [Chloroflexota bacterium]|nr:methylglyoxal synthase [Chloroflexota bacterium]